MSPEELVAEWEDLVECGLLTVERLDSGATLIDAGTYRALYSVEDGATTVTMFQTRDDRWRRPVGEPRDLELVG